MRKNNKNDLLKTKRKEKVNMKKYKLFAFAIITAVMSIITVNAREMTVSELGQAAMDQYKESGKDVGYIYVIGEYAFTSQYDIKTEDIMLAAKSIDITGDPVKYSTGTTLTDAYKKMVINTIRAQVDDDFNVEGWYIASAAVGTSNIIDSTTLNIRYIDYVFQPEKSKADIKISSTIEDETYKSALQTAFGIQENDIAKLSENLSYSNGSLTGLMLRYDITKGFAKEEQTGYYLPFVIEVPGLTDDTVVTIEEDSKATAVKNNFDIKDTSENKVPGIVVLWSIPGENGRKITITVDLDGPNKNEYESTTYTIDYTDLRFQQESKAELKTDNLPEDDVKSIEEDWGYKKEEGEDTYTLSPVEGSVHKYELTGTIVRQTINKDVFPEDEMTGYYFLFNVGVDKDYYGKATVTFPGNKATKTSTITDETGVTILFSTSDTAKNKEITIKVDLDGDDNEYFPVEYTIDLSKVVLEKSSEFTVESLTDENKFDKENGWYNEEDGYSVTVQVDEHDKTLYHVSGVLPIVEDESWKIDGIDPESEELYYLGLLLKLTEKEISGVDKDNINVKFFHDATEDGKVLVSKEDFANHELYILKALAETSDTKEFTITVDLDGDGEEGKEYAPYTVTIDWSKLTLQKKTTGEISVEGSSSTTTIPQSEKNQLTSWGYTFPNDIKLSEDNTHNKGDLKLVEGKLTGTIKEQKLTGGFNEEELDSYFYTFTIKPQYVTDDIKITLTVGTSAPKVATKDNLVADDNGNYVLTVLQNVSKPETDSQEVKIIIDADGDKKGYLPSEEYKITYDKENLDFVDLHTVTITDNEEKTQKTETIYDGEKLTKPEDPKPPVHEGHTKQYNTFNHWNKKDETESTEFKFNETTSKSEETITDDVTLYPIWEIDVEQYMSDVIKHVNETESAQDKFKIEESTDGDTHNLTVDILERTTKISEITDTDIAEAIAHALSSGEIDSIEISFNSDKTFNASSKDSAETIEQGIKDFLKTELSKSGEETLDDLYKNWQDEQEKDDDGKDFTITIMPNDNAAILKDKDAKQGIIYNVSFEEELIISYDAGALTDPATSYIKTNGDVVLPEPEMSEEEKAYRTFDGWFEKGQKVENLTKVTTDHDLTAHYTINVDKFVEEVVNDLNSDDDTYSNSFKDQFDLTFNQENNEITINLKNANVPLTTLADTSIPGTIAYILQRGEITGITLSVDGQTVDFNTGYSNESKEYTDSSEREVLDAEGKALKENIVKGAKEKFDNALSNKEATATLDQLEFSDKTFTLKIGDTKGDDTVKLVDSNSADVSDDNAKTYTFKFDSDFAVVNEANSGLGASTIQAALESGHNYKEVLIDGNINLEETLSITANNNVTIEPVTSASGINLLASEPTTTISTSSQDYVFDIQAGTGTVTISDLKITGATKAEIKVEAGATVIINNVDVTGNIQPDESTETLNANIVVEGQLTVSNIKNANESYKTPTIALITSYSFLDKPVDGENEEPDGQGNIHPKAKVNVLTNMTRNDRYNKVQVNSKPNVDLVKETYYGSFYYVDSKNSQIYFMGIIDNYKDSAGAVYDYVKIYYYDDEVDFSIFGYTQNESTENLNGTDYLFQKFTLNGKEVTDKQKAQSFLASHTTNVIVANYIQKPSAALNMVEQAGLEYANNKVSGVITTQTDRKYYIPVTLTSNKFQNGVTTIDVTDPNGNTTSQVYTEVAKNNIARILAPEDKTMSFQLEAIKANAITGDNGKKYTIKLDIDGSGDQYEPEIYEIDYSETLTEEEIINRAVQNTQNLNSLTTVKNNRVKSGIERFTYEFDREKGFTHYKSTDNSLEQYSFRIKYLYPDHPNNTSIVVSKKTEATSDKPELNGWLYDSTMTQVGTVTHELNLLQDRILSNQNILNAINEVKKVDNKDHTYQVTLNKAAFEKWVNATYISEESSEPEEVVPTDEDAITITVELDAQEQYVKSIKTDKEFNVSTEEFQYSKNTIDVQYSEFDTTTIDKPEVMIKDEDGEATIDELKQLYEDGKKYWKDHTGADIFEG